MYFCDIIEKYQKTLKLVKNEKVIPDAVVIQESKQATIIQDADLINEMFNDENDEDLDSNDCGGSTTSASESTGHFNLRKKTLPEMKNVSIVLERLDITYEPSDSESASEDEEEVEKGKSIKRRLSSSSPDLNASKRMRISPIKVVSKKSYE